MFLVVVSLAAAIAVALPLGLGLERLRGGAEAVIRAVGVLQTMPGIALLAFMIPLLGIGVVPALVALFLYSLYPILRNTYTGVRDAAPDAVSAATALGMTPRPGPPVRAAAARGAAHHGRDPDRGGDQRGHGHARGLHRRRRAWAIRSPRGSRCRTRG